MKVIAYYLPQFYTTLENDKWWGKGFTDWVNVRRAKPLYKGHRQPREPLQNNYYDLSDVETQKWQISLAKEYGIYGFCMYHYWFHGKKLLEKPVENYLAHRELDLPFCLSWANSPWTNEWGNKDFKVLIHQNYGDRKHWKKHFDYLLPYFKDDRYIRIDGKPLFILYRADLMDCVEEMLSYWKELALKSGLPGLCFAWQHSRYYFDCKVSDIFDYGIEYQPGFAQLAGDKGLRRIMRKMALGLEVISQKYLNGLLNLGPISLTKISYDEVWKKCLFYQHDTKKMIPGGFVDWDNTPRRGIRGSVMTGASPEKFKYYFKQQIRRVKENYKKDMLFLFSWNEWAEGGYLEPDEQNGFQYLEAVRDVLKQDGEFPW